MKCGSAVAVAPTLTADVIAIPSVELKVIRPYRWGLFQGWCLVLALPLLAVIGFATATTENDRSEALGAAIMSALNGRLPIVVCDPPIVTTPKAASLRAYLELVEQYCEVLTSPRLEDTHKGDEMQLPSFDQFLDERGYSELAQLVREVSALRSGERSSEPLISRNTEVVREGTP
jgi:hypothetical protein